MEEGRSKQSILPHLRAMSATSTATGLMLLGLGLLISGSLRRSCIYMASTNIEEHFATLPIATKETVKLSPLRGTLSAGAHHIDHADLHLHNLSMAASSRQRYEAHRSAWRRPASLRTLAKGGL